MSKKQLYIERRAEGDYAVRKGSASRASAVLPTQGNLRLDRVEFAAHIGGRIGLWIPDVDMGGPSLQEDHDHAFRRLPAPRAGMLLHDRCCLRLLLPKEEMRHADAHHSDRPNAQQFAQKGPGLLPTRPRNFPRGFFGGPYGEELLS